MNDDRSDDQVLAAFGQAVRQFREQRGMSPDDLSGVSRRSDGRKMSVRRIGRIEAGEGNPTYDEMLTLASGLARAPISVVRRDQLGEALAHMSAGRHHLAVPLLINPIEGIFWTAAADAGLIEQDRHGKWHCTAATSTPGKPVHGLEQVLVLPEVDLEDAFRAFLKAVVYGGAGDPFRHGTATSGWQLRASFLTIALMGWLETLNRFSVDTALCSAFARAATHKRVTSSDP